VITSKIWKSPRGQEFYFTIRYLPTDEVKESKGEMREAVVVCLYLSGKMFYFHYILTLKELAACATWEWRGMDQLDSLQMLFVFREVTNRFQFIANSNRGKLSTLTNRLKHFLFPKIQKREMTIHPLKYTLIGRELF
jgi:hypothetical protein